MTNLFLNYYIDSDTGRQQEIDECLSRNVANSSINRIYIITDNQETPLADLEGSSKIKMIVNPLRPTFDYFFALANSVNSGDDISIFSNTDIYFEEHDISLIRSYLSHETCFALSRWDKGPSNQLQLFDRHDSQDSWIFKGPIKEIANCDFTMGKPGCDNAIAQRIEAAGYTLYNPSKDIKSIHIHNTAVRNYDAADRSQAIDLPYKYIQPCSLESVPVTNWITAIQNLAIANSHSQLGEETVIDHIFKNIGVTGKYFVDLGAGAYGESTMSNTRNLLQNGWKGYGVDVNNKGESWIRQYFITPANILQIFEEQGTPHEFDFLNIDIDSSDFWVLSKILEKYSPRCICTEFNGTLDPRSSVVLRYEEDYTWDETNKYGYSFAAGKKLLEKYGYSIIYNMLDQNIFAVKKEFVEGMPFKVTASQVLYHPVNYNAVWESY